MHWLNDINKQDKLITAVDGENSLLFRRKSSIEIHGPRFGYDYGADAKPSGQNHRSWFTSIPLEFNTM